MRTTNMNWRALRRLLPASAAALASLALLLGQATSSRADDEIRIGNTMPYSGPAPAYGIIGKTIAAYFGKVNAEGGVNGRKINFISYDDGYNPQKAVEQTKKLVEEDNVLFIFAGLGTATSAATRPYLNSNKVPQLFVASGASMWDQPLEFPWTFGFQPSYQTTDTSLNQQIATLRASGADILLDVTTPKFATMAIRRVADLGWKPEHFISQVSESVAAVLQPAGLQNAEGIFSAGFTLEEDDPEAASDPAFR